MLVTYPILYVDLRFTHAKEDELEDEAEVDSDEPAQETVVTGAEETETPETKDTGSVNADIYLLFTKPTFPSTSNIGMVFLVLKNLCIDKMNLNFFRRL